MKRYLMILFWVGSLCHLVNGQDAKIFTSPLEIISYDQKNEIITKDEAIRLKIQYFFDYKNLPEKYKIKNQSKDLKGDQNYQCSTINLLELIENIDSYSQSNKELLQHYLDSRISYNHELKFVSTDGKFLFHYSIHSSDYPNIVDNIDTDNHGQGEGNYNLNNAPDYVEEVANSAVNSLSNLCGNGDFKFNYPKTDGFSGGDSKYDVYMVDLSKPATTIPNNDGTFFVLYDVDPFWGNDVTSMTHELFHAIQFSYSVDYSDFEKYLALVEGTAKCAEDVVYDEMNGYRFAANLHLDDPAIELFDTTGLKKYSTALYYKFLMQNYGKTKAGTPAYLDDNPNKTGYDPTGADVLKTLFETYKDYDDKDFYTFLDAFFSKFNTTFSQSFQEYSLINFTKQLGNPYSDRKLDYLEDIYYNKLSIPSDNIYFANSDGSFHHIFTKYIKSWTNSYYLFNITDKSKDVLVTFDGMDNTSEDIKNFNHFSVLMLKDNDNDGQMDQLVDMYNLFLSGNNNGQIYLDNENYDQIAVIVGKAKSNSTFNLDVKMTANDRIIISNASLDKNSYKLGEMANISVNLGDNLEGADVYFQIGGSSKQKCFDKGNGNYGKNFYVPSVDGLYSVEITASKIGFNDSYPYSIDLYVANPNEGHDIKAQTFTVNRTNITPGQSIRVEGSIENMGIFTENNIKILFTLKDPNGNVVDSEEDIVSSLPPNTPSQIYSHTLSTSSNSPQGYYTAEIRSMLTTDYDPSNDALNESISVGNINSYNQYKVDFLAELTKNVPYTANGYKHTLTWGPGTISGRPAVKVKVEKSGYSSERACYLDELTFFDNNRYTVIYRGKFGTGVGAFDYGTPSSTVSITPNQLIVDAGSIGYYYVSSPYNNTSPDGHYYGDDGDIVDPWFREQNNEGTSYEIKVTVPLNAERKAYSFWPVINIRNVGDFAQILNLTVHEPHNISGISISPNANTIDTLGKNLAIKGIFKNNGGYDEDSKEFKLEITGPNEYSFIDTRNFSIKKGQQDTVDFTINTSGLIPGDYSISISAILNNDPYKDNKLTSTVNLIEMPNQIPTATILKPNNFERIYTETQNIEGSAYDSDGTVDSLMISVNDAGWVNLEVNEYWSYLVHLQPDTNVILVKALDNRNSFSDIDTLYLIREPNLPIITVLSPNGNETLNANDPYLITWSSEYIEDISILFSSDSGLTYQVIESKIAADSSYYLQTPEIESDKCFIKLIDNLHTSIFDISDSTFTITKPTDVNLAGKNRHPVKYELCQNYPNPFNPSTVIRFSISTSSFVTIEIFNILGEKIHSFIDQELEVGTYELPINFSNYPSGIYIYRIKAVNFIQTKKMLLIK